MKRKFETKYGYFSQDGNEYVIKTYQTPKPWVNVISNGDYGLVISQTGGGFSWQTHSEFNRLNRWHQDLIQDNWGKYVYIRDNKSGKVWSPTFLPVKTKLNKFECRHGIGYTLFESEFKGIKTQLTIFVPADENLEIWDLKVLNNSGKDADLSLFTYFEWCLGSSADHHREFHRAFLETEFSKKDNAMFATKRLWEIPLGDRGHWNIDYQYYGFLSCNKKINDYESDKEFFVGQYGDLINPAALSKKKLSKQTGKWIDPIGCTKVDLKIKKNKSDNAVFYLGLVENKNDANRILKKYQTTSQIEDALSKVKNKWDDILGTLEIETPDESMNLLVNKWLRYQAISGRLWGRTAYYQQSGAFGFRDQLQDSLVFLPIDPKFTENQIRLHAKHQFEDGTVLHWWHPITDTGLPTKMTDDLLWLPFLLNHYYMETGNLSFFDEQVEFYDNKNLKTSLYDHSIRAINKVLSRMSERGLPLIGAGDWNDGLSAVGLDWKGESIWLAEFLFLILTEFQKISLLKNDFENARKLKSAAVELQKSFEKHAWDGEWFFRGTKDSGEKFGSKENTDGKIYLNAQTWAVISGISAAEKQHRAMSEVAKKLVKKNGPLLLYPAYRSPDKFIGYLSRYAAGRRENGGVYTHAATWAIWAFAKLKDAKNAYDVYKKLAPINNGMNPDEYVAEPYVTPGNIEGPDSPQYGRGGWTWYTGSAAWFQKVIVDWILGVRASEEGLVIDPCIPKEWKVFKIKRKFRGTVYDISVLNDKHVSSGVKKIEVDGVVQKTNVLINKGKKSSFVKVVLG
ncbi:MAG: glycosyl transferase family 36 [Ignavibacteriaceae bacterium]|nr:glycosyl transferase family 36 [Ignavibacteriaceae bacterium]